MILGKHVKCKAMTTCKRLYVHMFKISHSHNWNIFISLKRFTKKDICIHDTCNTGPKSTWDKFKGNGFMGPNSTAYLKAKKSLLKEQMSSERLCKVLHTTRFVYFFVNTRTGGGNSIAMEPLSQQLRESSIHFLPKSWCTHTISFTYARGGAVAASP